MAHFRASQIMVYRNCYEFMELVLIITFAICFHSLFHFFIIDFILSIFIDKERLQFIFTKISKEPLLLILWFLLLLLLDLLLYFSSYLSFFFSPKENFDE